MGGRQGCCGIRFRTAGDFLRAMVPSQCQCSGDSQTLETAVEHRIVSGWIGRQFSRGCIRRVRSSSEEVALFGRPSIRLRDASAFVKSDEKRRQGRPGAQIRSQSARSLNTGAAYSEHSRYGGVFKRGAGLLESERQRVAGHNLVKVVVARIPCPVGIV